MSDLSDLANALKDTNTTGMSADAAKAGAMAAGVIITVAVAMGGSFGSAGIVVAAGAAFVEALVALGFFPQTNQLQSAVDEIGARFTALLGADSKQLLMLHVADQISLARSARDFVRDNRPEDPSYAEQVALALNQSKLAVMTLGTEAYWLRSYIEEADYFGWDSLPMAPPLDASTGLVFEYRMTLPAYLEAIAIRLLVLGALKPAAREENQSEFSDLAVALATFYGRIRDAIVAVPPPAHPFPLSESDLVEWDSSTRHSDAVELFSAYSISMTYPLQLWPPHHQNGELVPIVAEVQAVLSRQFEQFVPKYLLIELVGQKQVYSDLGLGGVLTAVNALRRLSGQEDIRDHAADFSMRMIRQMLMPLMPKVRVDPNNPVIRLKESIGDIPRWLGIPTNGVRVSMRDVLKSPSTWRDMSVLEIEKELAIA